MENKVVMPKKRLNLPSKPKEKKELNKNHRSKQITTKLTKKTEIINAKFKLRIQEDQKALKKNWVRVLILALVACLILFPFLVMLTASFVKFEDTAQGNRLFPKVWSTESYQVLNVLVKGNGENIWSYFGNSLWITLVMTVVTALFSAMAGFGLYYFKTPLNKIISVLFMILMAIPFECLLLGRFMFNNILGWFNTPFALIWPFVGSVYTTYNFRSMFYRISPNTKKAAMIDGMSANEFFWSIAVPAILPAIITNFLISFISSWNSTLWPVLVLDPKSRFATIPVLLYQINTISPDQLKGLAGIDSILNVTTQFSTIPLKMATTTLSMAPLFVLFIVFNRPLMKGILKEWKR